MENKVKLSSLSRTIESLYIDFTENKFFVNRRYQRKLVWSLNDKKLLIDTILKSYPLPAILLLEDENGNYEILDGLHRLNSIFSYIENKFNYIGKNFDISSTSYTEGRVKQVKNTIGKDESRSILGYELSVLVLSGVTDYNIIDTIFKRINSAGKALSSQELRQAGSLSDFSEKVNEISSYIRGDALIEKKVSLDKMGNISLNIDNIGEGIDISEQFFIKNIILNKQNILNSEDEYLIAHLLGYILLDDKIEMSNNSCDWLYGIDSGKRGSTKKSNNIITTLQDKLDFLKSKNIDIKNNLIYVHDLIACFFTGDQGKKFQQFFLDTNNRALKEYYVFFIAIYEIIYNNSHENQKKIKDNIKFEDLIKKIQIIKPTLNFAQGGVQSVKIVKENINKIKTILEPLFESPGEKPGILNNDIESILRYSNVEGTFYDFKIGIANFSGELNVDKTLEKISKTIVGISNSLSKGKDYLDKYGYIILGVGDNLEEAKQIKQKFGLDYEILSGKPIFGVEKDLQLTGKTEDEYFYLIKEKIKNCLNTFSKNIFNDLLIESKNIRGKKCFVIKIPSVLIKGNAIFDSDKNVLIRSGNSLDKIEDMNEILEFNEKIKKFSNK